MDEILEALSAFGVTVAGLTPVERQRTGVFALEGADADGAPLLVRVYGRDAYDNQLLARAWLAYRESPEFREEFASFQKAFATGDLDAVTERLRAHASARAADRAAASRARRGR